MDISALGDVWYSAVLNSSQEFSDVGNLIKADPNCFGASVGGSTNDNGVYRQFNFSEYIPDTSGRLCDTINFLTSSNHFVSNITSCNVSVSFKHKTR